MANLNTDLLSPEQAIEATVAAYNSKDAIAKLAGLGSSASKIDGVVETCMEKVEVVTDSFTSGHYINATTGSMVANSAYSYLKIDYSEGEKYLVTISLVSQNQAIAVYYDATETFIGYEGIGVNSVETKIVDYKLTIPKNTAKIGFTIYNTFNVFKLDKLVFKENLAIDLAEIMVKTAGEWEGKTIVWFGTSIPAGSTTNNYPSMVGEALGATVVNEAIQSSMARNGNSQLVSETDPYGWTGLYWKNIGYSLSGTIAEKQYLIDNWATWRTKLLGSPPATLSAWDINYILDCSYENKLYRHLGENRKDLYVFDHGHNDSTSTVVVEPMAEYDRGYFYGAMNFLIKEILTDNPRAKICFIGHYENVLKPTISAAQKVVAETHDFPLLELWSKLGWTQRTILVDGVSKALTAIWMTDNLHPHTDTTGVANQKIASYITSFIKNEVR